MLQEAARALRRLDRELSIQARLEIGDAAEGVLRVAEEAQPALIVLAAHGEGDFPRLGSLGRVARRVLQRGRQPVLLVLPEGKRLCRPRGAGARRRAVASVPAYGWPGGMISPLQTPATPL